MATILEISDFKGFSNVKLNGNQVDRFNQIIEDNEFEFLSKMLGVELAELFKTDYIDNSGVPSEQRFKNLLKEMNTQWGRKAYTVNTIKYPLALFIYSIYFADGHVRQTTTGSKQTESENSKTPTVGSYKHYNNAIVKGKAVQAFIQKNISDYPEFRGQRLYSNNPLW